MTGKIQQSDKVKSKMSFFDYAAEIAGWLQIVASPFLAGLVTGAIIYLSNRSTPRLIIAIGITLVGLIAGIYLATRVWKRQGTMHFLSRTMATPDLDHFDEEKK